jgi:hypothetical protein
MTPILGRMQVQLRVSLLKFQKFPRNMCGTIRAGACALYIKRWYVKRKKAAPGCGIVSQIKLHLSACVLSQNIVYEGCASYRCTALVAVGGGESLAIAKAPSPDPANPWAKRQSFRRAGENRKKRK